ncbi:MAG: hypothetical protein RLZZ626_1097 [Actinomycetota bacterium]
MSRSIRVGVVHSDADFRFGLRQLIASQEDLEYVFEESSAAAALERLPDALVDVLLVEYFLAGMTGADFAEQLGERLLASDAKQIPVVLLNVGFNDGLRLRMVRSGVSDVLPLDPYPETVLQSIRTNAFGGPSVPRVELLELFEKMQVAARPNPALALGLNTLADADAAAVALFAAGNEDSAIAAEIGEQTFRVRRRLEKIGRGFGFATRQQFFLALYENGKLNARS